MFDFSISISEALHHHGLECEEKKLIWFIAVILLNTWDFASFQLTSQVIKAAVLRHSGVIVWGCWRGTASDQFVKCNLLFYFTTWSTIKTAWSTKTCLPNQLMFFAIRRIEWLFPCVIKDSDYYLCKLSGSFFFLAFDLIK